MSPTDKITFEKVLSNEQLKQYNSDGYLAIPEFISDADVLSMMKACDRLLDKLDPQRECTMNVFNTTDHHRNTYFLESGDKIRYFFDDSSLDENGALKVNKRLGLNKIGHALHWFAPEFKSVTFSNKIKSLVHQLGYKNPAVVQSMYIFKSPGFGAEVKPHKDCTFLSTDPQSCTGIWIALEDATLENGCLQFSPGSQNDTTTRRFVRTTDNSNNLTVLLGQPDKIYDNYVYTPVTKGSLVIINGQVSHKSDKNTSPQSRNAYTFHIIEQQDTVWDKLNWLQPTQHLPFKSLFDN